MDILKIIAIVMLSVILIAFISLTCIIYFRRKPLSMVEMTAKVREQRKLYATLSRAERDSKVGKQILKSILYLEERIKQTYSIGANGNVKKS